MISQCPLCSSIERRELFSINDAPLLPFIKDKEVLNPELFSPLSIVECGTCGHWFNYLFDPSVSARMYAHVITNRPVDISMFKSLDEIASWIGDEWVEGKRIVEVGGGAGHFARVIAKGAKEVVVFEPSSGLSKDALPEKNISLINKPFVYDSSLGVFDLVVCRQVVEHVSDPRSFICDMAKAISENGRLYIEVPRAEYIKAHQVVIELHNAHVQYFFEDTFSAFARSLSLDVDRSWVLKGGHDMGFLLKKRAVAETSLEPSRVPTADCFFRERVASDQKWIRALPQPISLYGANWQGASFFNLFEIPNLLFILDDNIEYAGSFFFKHGAFCQITMPTADKMDKVESIIVTAHLHFPVIKEKLRSLGFKGQIVNAINLSMGHH